MTNGHSVPLEMDPSDTILDVKKQIKDHEQVEPELQKLLFRDEEMTDDRTLESIQTIAGSHFFALVNKERMHIDVDMQFCGKQSS